MRRTQRGMTLLELIVSMGLSLIVLSVGYGAYSTFTRADDVERQREQLTLTAQNALGRIKEDVRSASTISASGGTLALASAGKKITYNNLTKGSGLERKATRGRCLFKGVAAHFTKTGSGVTVSVTARAKPHRRAIGVDLNSFVAPRH